MRAGEAEWLARLVAEERCVFTGKPQRFYSDEARSAARENGLRTHWVLMDPTNPRAAAREDGSYPRVSVREGKLATFPSAAAAEAWRASVLAEDADD